MGGSRITFLNITYKTKFKFGCFGFRQITYTNFEHSITGRSQYGQNDTTQRWTARYAVHIRQQSYARITHNNGDNLKN